MMRSEADLRLVLTAIVAGVVTAAAPIATGGPCAVLGLIAAAVMARSGFTSDESTVTAAVLLGGLVVVVALPAGHTMATLVAVGVFAGAEVAALARSFDDGAVSTGGRTASTAASIAGGAALAGLLLAAAHLRAGAAVTVVAAGALVLVAAIALTMLLLKRAGPAR